MSLQELKGFSPPAVRLDCQSLGLATLLQRVAMGLTLKRDDIEETG